MLNYNYFLAFFLKFSVTTVCYGCYMYEKSTVIFGLKTWGPTGPLDFVGPRYVVVTPLLGHLKRKKNCTAAKRKAFRLSLRYLRIQTIG